MLSAKKLFRLAKWRSHLRQLSKYSDEDPAPDNPQFRSRRRDRHEGPRRRAGLRASSVITIARSGKADRLEPKFLMIMALAASNRVLQGKGRSKNHI